MNYLEMEKKWRKKWADTKLYSFDKDDLDNKLYCLEMFSYPSGARLHVGHWYNYGPADTYARFKKQQGYNVFHPMGFDAFGLPAENYAIKTGVHPKDSTEENMTVMMEQLKSIGSTIDWDYTLRTNSAEYYKWTQWLFLQLYKHNLAYRAEAPVNWCPSCNTVLANEQVIDGSCERCHSTVRRRNLTQWFFRITAYADELLDYLPKLDWPERIKAMQTNWIGRSEGAELTFQIEGGESFKVFTTRPDTLMGCTYCVFAPEHPMVDGFTTPEQRQAVEAYRLQAATASEIDRLSTTREKTGVFTGGYALHPITGQRIPIWVADYVLYSYGTGAVMAVPGHDDRDFEFADKFGLPIVRVISGGELPYVGGGKLVNSGQFDGLDWEDAKQAIVDSLGDSGRMMINYRMRDWLISRQRYWGAPIPIIHCEKCGAVPVPEQQLPVELPYDVEFMPDGTSPLLKHEGFMNVKCPQCGGDAKRDADTMDTFVCSSWYFLRHPDNMNGGQAFDKDLINKMLPVDVYIGGAEHAVMHLLYARFFVKALRDMGMLDFDEPFTKLVNQGVILGVDGEKMSKSRGNVVSPDDYLGDYGSDIFRMYLMFGFNYVDGGAWNDDGIKSLARYLERVERLVEYVAGLQASPVLDANPTTRVLVSAEPAPVSSKCFPELEQVSPVLDANGTACVNPQIRPRGGQDAPVLEQQLRYVLANTIQRVTEDADRFMFNTSIARLMELTNAMYKYRDGGGADTQLLADTTHQMVIMLAPFAPHFAEEMNERLGMAYSVINHPWPEFRPQDLVLDVVEIAVQVNGKLRARLEIPSDTDEDGVKQAVLADDRIQAALAGKDIKKVIVVKGKLVNIVAK